VGASTDDTSSLLQDSQLNDIKQKAFVQNNNESTTRITEWVDAVNFLENL